MPLAIRRGKSAELNLIYKELANPAEYAADFYDVTQGDSRCTVGFDLYRHRIAAHVCRQVSARCAKRARVPDIGLGRVLGLHAIRYNVDSVGFLLYWMSGVDDLIFHLRKWRNWQTHQT